MPAQADAVDASTSEALPSFLPHGPNVVAQALWSNPALRGQKANELARTLHVSVVDARAGIAAMIGMINRTARGQSNTSLSVDPSLQGAVGPFMSLDAAMSRYGAHIGPIVRSPNPLPAVVPEQWAPDRQWGAGRVSGLRSRGQSGDSRRGAVFQGEAGMFQGEAGDVSPELETAAQQMLDFLHDNGCGVAPAGVVGNFQIAYNAAYSAAIAVDDKYGPETRTAAMQTIHDARVGSVLFNDTAPPACSYSAVRPAPAPRPTATPSTPSTAPRQQVVALSMGSGSLWMWALAAAAAGAVVLANSKHPPKWTRPLRVKHAR